MKPARELTPELREALADLPVSKLAEYICERVELATGERMLQLEFVDGRYERMRRFAPANQG